MEEQRHLRDRPTSRATEVAQQIFLRPDPALALLHDEFSPATWLHRIALNRWRNRSGLYFRRHCQGTPA